MTNGRNSKRSNFNLLESTFLREVESLIADSSNGRINNVLIYFLRKTKR